ncbi:hypothetical protein LMTR3_14150 [Bradyrhizobium sp. LMTR 3]|nr:hypothetical protein LMTR3_14150 [Bradyrhizobium sp. LMTR 3]
MINVIDDFADQLRDAIAAAAIAVSPASPCADAARDGLARIAGTLGQVPDVTLYNLASADRATGGIIMMALKIRLRAVGGGPTLDHPDAATFLDELHRPLFDTVRKRRVN